MIAGGDGNDRLNGGAGDDELFGERGFDTLVGGLGDDNLLGGDDNDSVSYTSAAAGVSANLTTNTATGDGDDVLDSVEHLSGSQFDDVLVGGAGANNIVSHGGDDVLDGAAGDDFGWSAAPATTSSPARRATTR